MLIGAFGDGRLVATGCHEPPAAASSHGSRLRAWARSQHLQRFPGMGASKKCLRPAAEPRPAWDRAARCSSPDLLVPFPRSSTASPVRWLRTPDRPSPRSRDRASIERNGPTFWNRDERPARSSHSRIENPGAGISRSHSEPVRKSVSDPEFWTRTRGPEPAALASCFVECVPRAQSPRRAPRYRTTADAHRPRAVIRPRRPLTPTLLPRSALRGAADPALRSDREEPPHRPLLPLRSARRSGGPRKQRGRSGAAALLGQARAPASSGRDASRVTSASPRALGAGLARP